MIITEQGKIAEVCAEPGEFTYNASAEPSIFTGSLGDSFKETFKIFGRRFSYGGDTGRDQRVYYCNTREIIGNHFSTSEPLLCRAVDPNLGLNLDVSLFLSGDFSYKITDPVLFYTNVAGNITGEYKRISLDSQLRTELIDALQPAAAKLSHMELRQNQFIANNEELKKNIKEALPEQWGATRGIAVVNIAIENMTLTAESAKMIRNAQKAFINTDPRLAAASLMSAQAQAINDASVNSRGGMAGFLRMDAPANSTTPPLFSNGFSMKMPNRQNGEQVSPPNDVPYRKCGNCETEGNGNYCRECGAPLFSEKPRYRCGKCGWEPEDPHSPPNFCPECGDPFNSGDIL